MSIIEFAGIKVKTEPKYAMTRERIKKYTIETDCEPDIAIELDDGFIKEKQIENPHLSLEECEYTWLGAELFNKLIDHGAFMLHASAVCVNDNGGEAYLFSAPSGTGKSTHTSMWLKAFPEKDPFILNDDKPIIHRDSVFKAAGSPFSGSLDISENRSVKIKGICFLCRGDANEIKRATSEKSVRMLLDQTVRPRSKQRMIKLLDMIDLLIKEVPVFVMRCLPDINAALTAYEAMSRY